MIINSLLDTDWYKLTMQQVVFHQFSDVDAKFRFKLRNMPDDTLVPLADEIQEEIYNLERLKLTCDEKHFLRQFPYMSRGYIEYLRNFQFNVDDYVYINTDNDEFELVIEGPWLSTILFETPVLAIISEIYGENIELYANEIEAINRDKLRKKCAYLEEYANPLFKFADFGTRRRHSYDIQNNNISYFKNVVPEHFVGTSNVHFAMKYNLKPIGTQAHEYFQAAQALVRLRDSQKYALQCWADEYRGNLGIALSDTVGFDAFLHDFDAYFAKLFDGCRHDSGDPYEWCQRLIDHYTSLDIDPLTKTAVFSDGLNFEKALDLHQRFGHRINTSFGIGTWLTNDCGYKPMQIVIKMTECNGSPVAKISDSPGKQMCEDGRYLRYLARQFYIDKERVAQ